MTYALRADPSSRPCRCRCRRCRHGRSVARWFINPPLLGQLRTGVPGVFPGLATQQQKQQQGQCQPANAYCVGVRNYGGAVVVVAWLGCCLQLRGPLKTEQSHIKDVGLCNRSAGKHSSSAGLGFGAQQCQPRKRSSR